MSKCGYPLRDIAAEVDMSEAHVKRIIDGLEDAPVVPEPVTEHVPIRLIPLDQIKPHWLNDKIYGPIDPDDPDVRALSASIEQWGLKEPLVLTRDHYVLSGHRRRVACILADLKEVTCRIEAFDAFDDRVPEMLATFNRQRVKTADTVIREEIILSNPEEVCCEIIEHRQRFCGDLLQLNTIPLKSRKNRSKRPSRNRPSRRPECSCTLSS
jgi:hypothetical protein